MMKTLVGAADPRGPQAVAAALRAVLAKPARLAKALAAKRNAPPSDEET